MTPRRFTLCHKINCSERGGPVKHRGEIGVGTGNAPSTERLNVYPSIGSPLASGVHAGFQSQWIETGVPRSAQR